MKKNSILLALLLVLFSTTVVAGFVRPAVAQGPIYIRADGSIEGTTAISTVDNTTYTFTNNINGWITVERSNIIIDGAGYTLQAPAGSTGLLVSGVNNVTIKNTNLNNFLIVAISLDGSSNNNIIANTITVNDMDGILLADSSNNNISGNTITENGGAGIRVAGASSTNNSITANNIANNDDGIILIDCSNNSIIANNITANDNDGIRLDGTSNNTIYHNNIIDNGIQVNIVADGSSVWDDSVGMGNYWSDYESRYPNATEVDGSGIWDTPYVIDGSNQDNYPIIPEFPTWTSMLLLFILLTVAIAIYKQRLPKTPIH